MPWCHLCFSCCDPCSGYSFGQVRVATRYLVVGDCHGQGLGVSDQYHGLLAAGDRGIEEVSLEEGEVGRVQADDNEREFTTLAFVHGGAVSQGKFIEVAAFDLHFSAINIEDEPTRVEVA